MEKRFTSRTLQLGDYRAGRTLYLTVLLLVLITASSEMVLRSNWVQFYLKKPFVTQGYRSAEERLQLLDAYVKQKGQVSCIFLGSSMVAVGLNPLVFSDAYQAHTGVALDCFNFGVAVATASSYAPLINILIHEYHPRLIILGLSSRDFDGRESYEPEAVFQYTPWAQYHEGKWSVAGWLAQHSFIYRYLSVLPERLAEYSRRNDEKGEADTDRPKEIVARPLRADYAPMIYFHDVAPIYVLRDRRPYEPSVPKQPFVLSPEDFEGYVKSIEHAQQSDTRLLIVEMPTPEPFFVDWSNAPAPSEPQVFRDQIMAYARDRHVPAWQTRDLDLVAYTDFADVSHLYVSGAIRFSQWLGAQVGEASRLGLLDGNIPETLIVSPPLRDWSVGRDDLLHHGMSPDIYQQYLAYQARYTLTPPGAVVYNPLPEGLPRQFSQAILGFFINYAEMVDEHHRQEYFDLLVLQSRLSYRDDLQQNAENKAILTLWEKTHMPGYLRMLGAEYLFFTERWNDETTTPDPTLGNALYYTLLKSWEFPPLHETYYLYQVISDAT
ncbi:MAG: hypothetical protein HPY45_07120 [Anaerolineae bacterium]|nr:hypothetical protein [Anaerolineae bacterium]